MTFLPVLPFGIFILPPRGKSRLPFVEVPRPKVEKRRASIKIRKGSKAAASADCSFGTFKGHLDFDAWQFFHAAKKTELAGSFSVFDGAYAATLAGAEYRRFFEWFPPNFRIRDQGIFSRVDATRTYLAGRSAVATNSLLMNLWGYAFWDHIPTLYARALTAANISHTESVRRATIIASKYRSKAPDKEPDFAFEMANGNVALMESKGRFVNYGDANPPAKGDLNEALDQLKDWPRLIQPTPQKSFGMGTYLREMRDKTDPSLILFVDPPPRRQRDDIEPLEFPKDWIRRGNYGNWLVGMGLEDAGIALREGREKQIEEVSLPVLELGGRSFVFTWEGWAISSRRAFSLEDFFHWHGPMLGRSWAVISGIEIGVMKLIERSVRNAADPALMEVEPLMEFTVPDQYYASVLPDGTLWGAIRLDDFWHPRSETFKL